MEELFINIVSEAFTLFETTKAHVEALERAEPEAFKADAILLVLTEKLVEHFVIERDWPKGELIEKLFIGSEPPNAADC